MTTKQTKLQRAMALYDSGINAHAAAKEAGLAAHHVYVELKRRREAAMREQGICPCCGQKLPVHKS